jgi:hypothetical protein
MSTLQDVSALEDYMFCEKGGLWLCQILTGSEAIYLRCLLGPKRKRRDSTRTDHHRNEAERNIGVITKEQPGSRMDGNIDLSQCLGKLRPVERSGRLNN